MAAQSKAAPPFDQVLRDACKKALGGSVAGALAMVVQVVALMWYADCCLEKIQPCAPPQCKNPL